MNKAELIEAIAVKSEVPKTVAQKVLDATTTIIRDVLQGGDQVTLIGFGTFAIKERKERKGMNPATREEILIPAAKIPSFKPGKALKDAVN